MSKDEKAQEQSGQEEQLTADEPKSGTKKSRKQQRQLDKLNEQVEQLTQDVQRERADFANYRRRAESDKQQTKELAKAELLADFLPVVDDLERALAHQPDDLAENAWAQGVAKVYEQLQQVLNGFGIERIAAEGEPFDPNLHEAVGYEGDGDSDSEVIIEELRAGYRLNGGVLRPTMVRVGNQASDNHDDNDKQVKEEDNG